MPGFISSSPFHNTKHFLQIQSLAPGIARRSSERFQLRRAITLNTCIVCRIRGYRCVRLVEGFVAARSVRRLDPRISGNRLIWLRLQRGSSSPPWISTLVLYFFSPPCAALSLPTGPLRVPALLLRARPAPAPWRGGGDRPWRRAAWARQPAAAAQPLRARPGAPCARGPAAQPRPRPPRRRPSPPLRSSLFLPPWP
jgi:hypothetical protein